MSKKISKEGKYLSYFGVTVLCFVKNSRKREIFEFLSNSELSKIFSPLPCQSYHMTVFDLCVPKDAQTKDLFYEFLENYSQKAEMIKEAIKPFKKSVIKINSVYWGNTLGLEVFVRKKTEKLRNVISKASGNENNFYKFHITLGYRYTDKNPNQEDIENLKSVCRRVFGDSTFVKISGPKLCKFSNMEKFIEY